MPAVAANAADHATIDLFLQSVFPGHSTAEFQASLDDPFYEPQDRLLLRQRRRIVAHVRLVHRAMHFGAVVIPITGIDRLGVAAEFRKRGLGGHLLRAAEARMESEGALLGVVRTASPGFFRRAGWVDCPAESYRRADACALLARLWDRRLIHRRRRRFHIRPLLRWEYPALARIYAQNILQSQLRRKVGPGPDAALRCPPIIGCTAHGPLERTEAYWKWLLDRRAFGQLFVALEGLELLEIDESKTRVVGYAVARGAEILELMAAPDCPRAAAELLARCCCEGVENGRHSIILHAPRSSRLFRLFDEAGGVGPPQDSDRGETDLIRLLDPVGMLRRLSGEFDRRASAAGLTRPLELGFFVEGRKYRLELGLEGVKADARGIGRSYLRLNRADFTRLVLGQLDWDAAVADRRLECSTALAAAAGRALFPRLPFWRPPWDDLPNTERT